MPVLLEGSEVPLPRNFAPTLMKDAFEAAVVGQLTPSEPQPLGQTAIPQYDGGIEAGVVAEGGQKPVSEPKMSVSYLRNVKLATIVVISKEAARLNPGRMVEHIQADLRNAISRAVDYGIFYGRDARTGAQIADMSYVNQTSKAIALPAESGSDLVPPILEGYDLAAAGNTSDPDGFAFDTRMRTRLSLAGQQQPGTPQPLPNLATAGTTVAGLKAAYGRVVAGRIGTQAETGVAGFVGDWSKVRWGFAENITMNKSNEATVIGTDGQPIYLWQQNLMALLVEAEVGWAVTDTDAFARYTYGTAPVGG